MGITFDLAQLVLDNEVAGLIKRTVKGIEVNDETLSLDTIKEVGPFKDYLAHETTFKHMRLTTSPKLMDRKMRPRWEKAGSKDAYERARDEVKHILEDPTIGTEKKGDLRGIFVHKFKLKTIQYLLAYRIVTENLELIMIGPHENYYRDLSSYLEKR